MTTPPYFDRDPKIRAWQARGLSRRAAARLAELDCHTADDVRRIVSQIGVKKMKTKNIGGATVAEIGRKLFNEDWSPRSQGPLSWISDQDLIATLQARGYRVTKN